MYINYKGFCSYIFSWITNVQNIQQRTVLFISSRIIKNPIYFINAAKNTALKIAKCSSLLIWLLNIHISLLYQAKKLNREIPIITTCTWQKHFVLDCPYISIHPNFSYNHSISACALICQVPSCEHTW